MRYDAVDRNSYDAIRINHQRGGFTMKKFLFFAIIAAVCVITPVKGRAEVSPYIGLGLGLNSFDSNLAPAAGASVDDSDSGARFFLGARLNDFVGLELMRADFGAASLRGGAGSGFTLNNQAYVFLVDGELSEDVDTWAYGITLSLPLNRLNHKSGREILIPYLRFGLNSWNLDQTATFSGTSVSFSDSGTNPWFGVGFMVDITRHAGLRLAYDWFVIKDDDGVLDRIGSLGLDLMLRF